MPDALTDPGTEPQPFAEMGCPRCNYDLTGTTAPRCPECGQGFDPRELLPVTTRRPLPLRVSLAAVLLAVYLPNTWVLWIDYPWNSYRLTWVMMFPSLPGVQCAAWVSCWTGLRDHMDHARLLAVSVCITAVLISMGVTMARRSWWWLALLCVAVLALEVYNAYACHGLFRM
jgi:hypothetical protein